MLELFVELLVRFIGSRIGEMLARCGWGELLVRKKIKTEKIRCFFIGSGGRVRTNNSRWRDVGEMYGVNQ